MTSPDEEDDPLALKHTKSFMGHLVDLRNTIIWSVALLGMAMCVVAPFTPEVVRILEAPLEAAGYCPAGNYLLPLPLGGGFTMMMKIMFWGGLLISLPGLLFVIGRFIYPGLKPQERSAVTSSLGFAALLFAGGVMTGYFFTLPSAIRWLIATTEWVTSSPFQFMDMCDYIDFVVSLLLCFGLSFELPVVLVGLGHVGIVTSAGLREKRRHAAVFLMVMAMFLTPGSDPVSMLVMSAPLITLYEMCIWMLWFRERGKKDEPA